MNGWLFINKEIGITSFILIKILQTIIKVHIGYLGTLDPFASGFILIGMGIATKFLKNFQPSNKNYTFTIFWGISTNTGDNTGFFLNFSNIFPTKSQILIKINSILGNLNQIPHIYSSKKIFGINSYVYARSNSVIFLNTNNVFLYSFKLSFHSKNITKINIISSIGFYVRSFVIYISMLLNSYAHILNLNRNLFQYGNIVIYSTKISSFFNKNYVYSYIRSIILPLHFFIGNLKIYYIKKKEMINIKQNKTLYCYNFYNNAEKVLVIFKSRLTAFCYYYNFYLKPFKYF